MEPPSSHPSLLGAAALPTGASATAPTTGPPSWPGTTPYNQNIPPEVIDQIEVLKQQLRVYADDFATEREDRERNQAEKEKMRDELVAVKEQVQALEQQVSFVYKFRPCLKALMVIVMNRQTFEITVTNSYHTLEVYCIQQHYKHVTKLFLAAGVRIQHLSCTTRLDRLQFSFSHNFFWVQESVA